MAMGQAPLTPFRLRSPACCGRLKQAIAMKYVSALLKRHETIHWSKCAIPNGRGGAI
jgi:hypothetical protein